MALVLDLVNRDPRPRHPEKADRPDQPVLRKPEWIRVKAPGSPQWAATNRIVKDHKLVDGLRGGGLPQYRGMLGEEARDLHDHGGYCARALAPSAM